MKIGRRLYAALPKSNRGPGGWRCPCCRIGPLSAHKTMSHRIERRLTGQLTRLAVRDWRSIVFPL